MPRAFKRPAKTLWWVVVVVVVVRTPTPNYLRQASPDRGKYPSRASALVASDRRRSLLARCASRVPSARSERDRRWHSNASKARRLLRRKTIEPVVAKVAKHE